jgi:transcriptional regulator with XRE-family HTH domain
MLSGDLLREARLRAGLSQAELAGRAGKPTSVIGRWERNEVKPSFETLRAMVRACGLDLRFQIAERDTSQDGAVEAALDLTPEERFAQLEAWAELVLEGRRGLAQAGSARG